MSWQDNALATRALELIADWGLSDPSPIAETPTGLLLKVTTADHEAAVLKCLTELGVHAEGSAAATLAAFDGRSAVRLLRHTRDALLLEHCEGGDLLSEADPYDDEDAVGVFARVIGDLHRTPIDSVPELPTLADRCQVLRRAIAALSPSDPCLPAFHSAARLADFRLNDVFEPAILHGDLHHSNILRAQRADGWHWVTIDPQPLLGDPVYDLANVFGNPLSLPQVVQDPSRHRRLAQLFERSLGFASQRLIDWAYIHCLISAAWSIEDGEDPTFRLDVAHLIAPDISG